MNFSDLQLDSRIVEAIDIMRFTECTPIQEQSIPPLLEGRDLIGIAQTGTGKTAAYLLPVLNRLCSGEYPKDAINCIIMSPTRELAQQIDQAMEGFSYYVPFSSVAVYGGNDGIRYEQELKGMQLGADVIIATPGRLISHLKLGNVDLSRVSFFILDEADRMLDMGFFDDIMKIVSYLPKKRQTIMFSATMPPEIQKMANSILDNPVEIKIAISKPAEKINQSAYICYDHQKIGILTHLFKEREMKRVLVFASSKQSVKELGLTLRKKHINVQEMHSDLDQKQRDEVMRSFKAGHTDVLVATDIISRGIDIDDIETVINFDVPHDVEDYVHRIGRTARANRNGAAITLVNNKDLFYFNKIEKTIEKSIPLNEIPAELGTGPSPTKLEEKKRGRSKNRRRSNSKRRSKQPANAQASASKQGKEKPAGAHDKPTNRPSRNRRRRPKKPTTTE